MRDFMLTSFFLMSKRKIKERLDLFYSGNKFVTFVTVVNFDCFAKMCRRNEQFWIHGFCVKQQEVFHCVVKTCIQICQVVFCGFGCCVIESIFVHFSFLSEGEIVMNIYW
jgi:hypothetical protein